MLQMSARLGLGVLVGLAAAALLVFVMSRFLLTDNMEAAVALLFAVAAFCAADVLLSEAGLFATVTLGFVAANQRLVPTARIAGFGETLEVLIIGTLFILLGALVDIGALGDYWWQTVVLVAVLVLLVRPISVAVALLGSKLAARDRVLIAGVDPRGIVAAATAAQFAATLAAAGFDSGFILPVVFGVILGTGIVYGLGAAPLARRLGVARPAPTGVGIVGDAPWLTDLARVLQECGVPVLRVTARSTDETMSDAHGVPTISIADSEDQISAALDQAGLSQVLISNERTNLLTVVTALFIERLGRRHVILIPEPQSRAVGSRIAAGATARPSVPGMTRSDIERRVAAGATVRVVPEPGGEDVLPLAAVSADGTVDLQSPGRSPTPGETVIALVGAGSPGAIAPDVLAGEPT